MKLPSRGKNRIEKSKSVISQSVRRDCESESERERMPKTVRWMIEKEQKNVSTSKESMWTLFLKCAGKNEREKGLDSMWANSYLVLQMNRYKKWFKKRLNIFSLNDQEGVNNQKNVGWQPLDLNLYVNF